MDNSLNFSKEFTMFWGEKVEDPDSKLIIMDPNLREQIFADTDTDCDTDTDI